MIRYMQMAVCLLLSTITYGQQCSYKFSGNITDFHDGTAISNATILVIGSKKYAISDINGYFQIQHICKGPITLEIQHIGCETKTVTLNTQGDMHQNISLEHHIETLEGINLKNNATEDKTTQKTTINKTVIEQYSSESLGDALKEISGISNLSTGNNIVKPIINGMHSSRITTITNGVRLEDQEWGIEHAPNVDINNATRIEVVKGANALAYSGDAIGGVVILKPQRFIAKDSLFGKSIISGQTNGQGGSISTSINKIYKNKWYIMGNGSYKQYGDFSAPKYILTNTGMQNFAFSTRSGYHGFKNGFEASYSITHNNIGILKASHIGNIKDLVSALNNTQPAIIEGFRYEIKAPRQQVTHHLTKINIYKRFKALGKLNLQYDYQNNHRLEFDIRIGNGKNKASTDLNLQTHSLKINLKTDANKNINFNIGTLFKYKDHFANPNTGIKRLIPDYTQFSFGSFITASYRMAADTTLEGGFRYDYNYINAKKYYQTSRWEERNYNLLYPNLIIKKLNTQVLVNPKFNYHNITSSIGIKQSIGEYNNVILNYSISQRPPNPAELFSDGLHHSAARIELGKLNLNSEIANRIALTYQYKNKNLTFLLEGFYNHIQDYIYAIPQGTEQTLRGAFPLWNYDQTKATLFGVDFTSVYQLNTHWILSNKLAYLQGKNVTQKQPLIDMPPFNNTITLSYKYPHWKKLQIDFISEYVSRQYQYPNNNFNQFIPTDNTNVFVDISTPTSAYHLLHLNCFITIKKYIKVSLNIHNLLDNSYRNYLNRLRYFADDLGRNIKIQLTFNY